MGATGDFQIASRASMPPCSLSLLPMDASDQPARDHGRPVCPGAALFRPLLGFITPCGSSLCCCADGVIVRGPRARIVSAISQSRLTPTSTLARGIARGRANGRVWTYTEWFPAGRRGIFLSTTYYEVNPTTG